MFAIVRIKGFQHFVKVGEKIIVPKLDESVDSEVVFNEVLFLKTDQDAVVGKPFVKGVSVHAKVLRHLRAPKVTTFKFIRRENYRRLKGHKQPLTELEITDIKVS